MEKEMRNKALFFNWGTLASSVLVYMQRLVPKGWQGITWAGRKTGCKHESTNSTWQCVKGTAKSLEQTCRTTRRAVVLDCESSKRQSLRVVSESSSFTLNQCSGFLPYASHPASRESPRKEMKHSQNPFSSCVLWTFIMHRNRGRWLMS